MQPQTPPAAQLGGGRALEIPVRIPLDGRVAVTEANGVPIPATFANEKAGKTDRTLTVTVPQSERERVIVIAWARSASPAPLPPITQLARRKIDAGTPFFFDLERDAHQSFGLEVGEGGLYRVETLGRLKTSATIGTSFLPEIQAASDNGGGHNALIQTYLRGGSYRVDVSASESNGHLGILASPAPMLDAGLLVPEESARATIAENGGAAFTLDIPQAGKYRLDLYGLGRTFKARLEDAEGWPLTVPSAMSSLERKFAAGRYRLVVLPVGVEARVVARLYRSAEPATVAGHGPHTLAFDAVQKFEWREPEGKDAPRTPDAWEFSLAGAADIVLEISDGMIVDLKRTDPDAKPIGKIVYKRGFSGTLPAGHYVAEARALGRNDRLDYELTLRSTQLQPATPRFVDLPATLLFAVAKDRVASLTTFGRTELKAVLRDDADGHIVERLSGRADDWNIALSRPLAAGAYRLELSALRGGEGSGQSGDADKSDADKSDADAASDSADGDQPSASAIEVRLALPEVSEAPALAFTGVAKVAEARVHQFALPRGEAESLTLIAAQSAAEIVLSLEHRDADGSWRPAGLERGRTPAIAFPEDGDAARSWRISAWAVDGGAAPIAVAARSLRLPAQPTGKVTLAPFPIEGFARPVAVAAVVIPGASLVTLASTAPGLLQGSSPGRPLRRSEGGVLTPQSERLWLVARGGDMQTVSIDPLAQGASEIALALAEGETATIPPAAPAEGRTRVFVVSSSFGQPGLAGGLGTGIAAGSAIALAAERPLRVWNAGGTDGLRLRLATLDLDTRPPLTADAALSLTLPAKSAQPIRLPDEAKHITLDLAPGLAAFAEDDDGHGLSVWAADASLSREADGDWTNILIVNTSDKPRAASLSQGPASGAARLAAGSVLKRFFGATGSLALRVDAKAGDRLGVGGATAMFISEDGNVLRGTSFALPGPGEIVLDHGVGLVAVWIENGTASPWPMVAATDAATPDAVKLEGAAMRFHLQQNGPALLHARTNAPVILVFRQGDAAGAPILYPAGAEFHHYVAPGEADLALYSPHDGPLGGTLELTATPVKEMGEGLGEAQALAPGGTALFGFEVTRAGSIGVGVRAEPDQATAKLLDADGKLVGDGVTQFVRLEPGRYFLEVSAPAAGGTLTLRPAIIGLAPPPAGPPPEIVKNYLEMVGLTSQSR
jgi:hypothetical protein